MAVKSAAERASADHILRAREIAQGRDPTTQSLLFDGANTSQLAMLFGMERKDILRKLHGKCEPVGERKGHPIYKIAEAAEWLVTPAGNIEDALKRMNHADLPAELTARFWDGQLARDRYLLQNGELWPTPEVENILNRSFNSLSMAMQLLQDQIANRVELSPIQREILAELVDKALGNLHASIIAEFKDDKPRFIASDDDELQPEDGKEAEDDSFFDCTIPDDESGDL